MKQIIIIHGGNVCPTEDAFYTSLKKRDYDPFKKRIDWKDLLVTELQSTYQIIRPIMPNGWDARYKGRKIWFEKIFPYLNGEDLILVGHSLGGIFLMKYLAENKFPQQIKQLHLVAAVIDDAYVNDPDKRLMDFIFDVEMLPKIQKKIEKIFIYHSKDDNEVPYSHAEKIQSYLPNAKIISFTDRWHFIEWEFPELLQNIINN